MSVEDVLNIVKEKEVKFIDYRFTNTNGKEQHVTVTANVDGIKNDFEAWNIGKVVESQNNSNHIDILGIPR